MIPTNEAAASDRAHIVMNIIEIENVTEIFASCYWIINSRVNWKLTVSMHTGNFHLSDKLFFGIVTVG
jgi:hypothetical protein